MSWSADALRDGKYLDPSRDSDALAEFSRVAERLRREHRMCDALFASGSLHLSGCKRVLATATAEEVSGQVWSPEKVRKVLERAAWPEAEDADEQGYVWNVRLMLETCSRLGLGLELDR